MFADDGTVTPVTVLDAGTNVNIGVKSKIRLTATVRFRSASGRSPKKASTRLKQVIQKSWRKPRAVICEFRLDDTTGYEAGQDLAVADYFNPGDKIDVSGISKGRGFGGVMKKYNFAGFIRTRYA